MAWEAMEATMAGLMTVLAPAGGARGAEPTNFTAPPFRLWKAGEAVLGASAAGAGLGAGLGALGAGLGVGLGAGAAARWKLAAAG